MSNLEVNVTYSGGRKESIVVEMNRELWPRLRRAFAKIAVVLTSQVKRNLSGPSHTRSAGGAGNPFPGVVTGRLRGSATGKVTGSRDDLTTVVGLNTNYARIQEKGGTIIQTVTKRQQRFLAAVKGIYVKEGSQLRITVPARPSLLPAYEKQRPTIINLIKSSLVKG